MKRKFTSASAMTWLPLSPSRAGQVSSVNVLPDVTSRDVTTLHKEKNRGIRDCIKSFNGLQAFVSW